MSIQLKIKKIFNWLGVRTQSDKQNEDILLNSELFNEHWYLSQYPEVKMAPLKHFLYFGGFEGKNPSPDFDTDFYLSNNDDVKNSPLNPLIHYLCFGLHEERKIRPVVQSKKVTSKKLADLDVKECVAILERSELFDAVWYLRVNGVEGVSFAEASKHYVQEGWRLGFDPSPRFSTEYYLTCNGDVAKTGVNPLIHYLTIGKANKLPSSKSRYATYNLIGDIAVENHEVKHPIVTGLLHGGKPSVPVEQQPQFLLEELEKFDCKDEPFIRSALSVFNILSTKTVESRLLDELNTLQWRSGRLVDNLVIKSIFWKGSHLCVHLKTDSLEFSNSEALNLSFFQYGNGSKAGCIGSCSVSGEKPLIVVDLKVLSLFKPIVLVAYSSNKTLQSLTLLPFPTLFRGGLHYSEVLESNSKRCKDEISALLNYSLSLLTQLLERRIIKGGKKVRFHADNWSLGTESIFRPQFLEWMSDTFGTSSFISFQENTIGSIQDKRKLTSELLVEVNLDDASDFDLELPTNAIPTLEFLCSDKLTEFDASYLLYDSISEKHYKVRAVSNPKSVNSKHTAYVVNTHERNLLQYGSLLAPTSPDYIAGSSVGSVAISAVIFVGPKMAVHISDTVASLTQQSGVTVKEFIFIFDGQLPKEISNIVTSCSTFHFINSNKSESAEQLEAIAASASTDYMVYIGSPILLHDKRTLTKVIDDIEGSTNTVSGSCLSVSQRLKGKVYDAALNKNFFHVVQRKESLCIKSVDAFYRNVFNSLFCVDLITPQFILFDSSTFVRFVRSLEDVTKLNLSVMSFLFQQAQKGKQNIVSGKVSYIDVLDDDSFNTSLFTTWLESNSIDRMKVSVEDLV